MNIAREVAAQVSSEFASTGQGDVRIDIWVKGFIAGVGVCVPAWILGCTAKIDPILRSEIEDDFWNEKVLFHVAVPGLIWYMMITAVVGRIAYSFGADMLQESNADLKDSVRSNMASSGVILALILTIVLAMLQQDLDFEDENVRVAMWYRLLLVFATECCIKGILMCGFFLVYLEPLDTRSAKAFVIDNVNYLGEPMTGIMLSLFYFLMALNLYAFGTDGAYMGFLVGLVLAFTATRNIVVYQYLSCWKNPNISEEERSMRVNVLMGIRNGIRVSQREVDQPQ